MLAAVLSEGELLRAQSELAVTELTQGRWQRVLMFCSFSLLYPILIAAVCGHYHGSWLLGSPQNVSPRRVNIVFFLRAHGVVASCVLVPVSLVPSGLACNGSKDGPPAHLVHHALCPC